MTKFAIALQPGTVRGHALIETDYTRHTFTTDFWPLSQSDPEAYRAMTKPGYIKKPHIRRSKNHMFMWFFFLAWAIECYRTGQIQGDKADEAVTYRVTQTERMLVLPQFNNSGLRNRRS